MLGQRYRRTLARVVLPALAAILAGCVAATSLSNGKLSADDKGIKSDASVGTTAEFITYGKPTKTIETPWGPREIYDPVQDPKINEIFKIWYEENKYSIIDYSEYLGQSEKWNIFLDAEALQALDLKRVGCESVIQANSRLESYNALTKNGLNERIQTLYFLKDCGNQHNFGSPKLSVCEHRSKSLLPRAEGRRVAYELNSYAGHTLEVPLLQTPSEAGIEISNLQLERGDTTVLFGGKKNEVIGPSSGKNYIDQLSGIFQQSCEKWRGSKPHDSRPLKNGFTLFDSYPAEPLAPPEFQTPIFKEFIQQQREAKP